MTSTIVCKFVILTPVVTCISALYDCIHQGDDSNISIVIYNRRSFVRSAPELWSLWQIPPPIFVVVEVAAAKILMILSCSWYQPASKSLLRTLIQNNLFQLSPLSSHISDVRTSYGVTQVWKVVLKQDDVTVCSKNDVTVLYSVSEVCLKDDDKVLFILFSFLLGTSDLFSSSFKHRMTVPQIGVFWFQHWLLCKLWNLILVKFIVPWTSEFITDRYANWSTTSGQISNILLWWEHLTS